MSSSFLFDCSSLIRFDLLVNWLLLDPASSSSELVSSFSELCWLLLLELLFEMASLVTVGKVEVTAESLVTVRTKAPSSSSPPFLID